MIDCPEILNIRHLRMVQKIGQLGGVCRASRELNTSQPAVTLAVSNLEKDIGAEIFERCPTGTFPTEIGRLFLLRVDRFFNILESAMDEVLACGSDVSSRQIPQVERIITGTQIRAMIVTSEPSEVEETAVLLGVSSASLYRSIREMERAIGRPLFDRTANGPVCNKTGAYLARQMRRAIHEIEVARCEVKLAVGKEELEIVVGVLPMSGSFELANAVREFIEQRRSARVRILTGDYFSLLNDLGNCRIDMIFGLLRRPDWAQDVDEQAYFQDSFCIATRKGHPLSRVKEITPQELAKYDWIVPATGTPRRGQIDRLFDGVEKKPRFGIETSSLTTLRALLLGSDLITVMTRSEAHHDASVGVIECMPCHHLDAIPPKGITTRSDWLPTELHYAFLECLQSSIHAIHHGTKTNRRQIALVS